MTTTDLVIEPYKGDTQLTNVADVHLQVRRNQERSGEQRFQDIYDSQADLTNIPAYYIQPGGNFWIAKHVVTGEITGFVGLKYLSQGIGEVKRLAVVSQFRGHQLGRRLISGLVQWAGEHDFRTVQLATGKNEAARKLVYLPEGFLDADFEAGSNNFPMLITLV